MAEFDVGIPFAKRPLPLGPPFCDVPCPTDDPHPIRCGYQPDHEGPHGWDLEALKAWREEP